MVTDFLGAFLNHGHLIALVGVAKGCSVGVACGIS